MWRIRALFLVFVAACSDSAEPDGGVVLAEYDIWTSIPADDMRAVLMPDGSTHVFLRTLRSTTQADPDYVGSSALGTVTEYGEEFVLAAGSTTWTRRDIYVRSYGPGRASMASGGSYCFFRAGDGLWLTTGAGAYVLEGDAWTDAPALQGVGCRAVETDALGTAHILHDGIDGDIIGLTRFDGETTGYISVENQALTKTRPTGPIAIAARPDGSTDVAWIGLDTFNIEDPLWEEVLHHVRVTPDGLVVSPSSAAPPTLDLVTAWWRHGDLVRPAFVGMAMRWHDDRLQLFVTGREQGAQTGASDDDLRAELWGVLQATYDGEAWTRPSLIATATEPLTTLIVGDEVGDAALALVETLPMGELENTPTRWRRAAFSEHGLSDWTNPVALNTLAGAGGVSPLAVVRRSASEIAVLRLDGRRVLGSVFDSEDEVIPPAIIRAVATTPTTLAVTFDRVLSADTDLAGITAEGATITSRRLDGADSRVLLETGAQAPGAIITVRATLPGNAERSLETTSYAPKPLNFVATSSPFTDAALVTFDAQDRLIVGGADAMGVNVLEADRVTFARIPAPPAPIDGARAVGVGDGVWFSSERRLLQWETGVWTVHDEVEKADPYTLVHAMKRDGDALMVLFWSQTTTRLRRYDGAWTDLPEAPSAIHTFTPGLGGRIHAAGGNCCSYVCTVNLLEFDGSAWTETPLTEGNAGKEIETADDMAVAPDGTLLIAGTTKSINGHTIPTIGLHSAGTTQWISSPWENAVGSGVFITDAAGRVFMLDAGVSRYADGELEAIDGTSGARAAAFDRHGFLWTTSGGGGGLTGARGLYFHGPVAD